MKFSFSWLKDLSGYSGSAEKLAEVLSLHAFETEIIAGQEFKNIIVAKVLKVEKHPNADRLRVVELTDGQNIFEPVVCGAWNFEAGDIVPLALPGALIPHDQHDPEGKPFTLTKATIRGIESQGMICSGKELGVSDDGKGILKLDSSYKLGETFVSKDGEVKLDISLPANRPDLLGYLGVAREISALTYSKFAFRYPKIDLNKFKPKVLKVNISSEKLCPRYLAVRLGNVEIKPSPEPMQKRLREVGLRPINNIVDITNFVMLETGQPLHAFDASKVFGPINVRPAYVNEQITTLDGTPHQLNSQNLVIADAKQAIGIAGVMGGANTMIDNFTSEIILECANFDSVSIRKTARELGLRTDAAVRYEKSLPLALADTAATYAAYLIVQLAGAKVLEFVPAGVKPKPLRKIKLDPKKVGTLLGMEIKSARQKEILSKFGFQVSNIDPINVIVPFERTDVSIWQDLAEEIGRFEGLNEIEEVMPAVVPSALMTNPLVDKRQQVAEILAGLGYSEIYTYSFVSAQDLARWEIDAKIAIEVENPLTSDQKYMRPNLLPNILKTAEYNERYFDKGDYFEIGNVYWRENGQMLEKMYLGIFSYAKNYPVMKLVSSFRELCRRLNIEITIDQEGEQLAAIKSGKAVLGRIGRINVGGPNWVGVHLDFEEFVKKIKPKQFKAPNKYPSIELDVAVWARKDLPWAKVEQTIKAIDSKIINRVELFDIYTGKNVPMNKKSLAFRIAYESAERTLTEAEVEKVHIEVLNELKNRLNLEVR